MSHQPGRWRRTRISLLSIVLLTPGLTAVNPLPAAAFAGLGRAQGVSVSDFDIRDSLPSATGRQAAPLLSSGSLSGVSVQWNDRWGVPASLIRHGGYMSAASADSPETIARRFLSQNAESLGLSAQDLASFVVDSEALTIRNGVTQLVFKQLNVGRTVYGSALLFSIDRLGRIVTMGGPYFSGIVAPAVPQLTAQDAIARAADSVGAQSRGTLTLVTTTEAPSRLSVFNNPYADPEIFRPNPVTAELVVFPVAHGQPARLGWKTVIEATRVGWYESVVDGSNGNLLYQRNYYVNSSEGNVYTGESPAVSTQTIVSFAGAAFDNNGWVSGTTTSGNNVNAYQDLNGSDGVGYQPTTPACPDPACQHFDYTFTNAYATSGGTDVTTDRNAVVTQEFYLANFMHDYLYQLGFTEAFRNFQVNNFGRGGAAGDPVLAEADDNFSGGSTNNANFATPADGSSPRMQMFVFTSPPFAFTDGDVDADVVFHEYTHGLSSRLVGGGSLGGGIQTGALGEGWSDSMAASINNDAIIGEYVTGNATVGIRRVAYNNSPWVYTSLCNAGCEVHRDGEIWASALWDMRTTLIAKYGFATGKNIHELLMVDGMKNTVSTPNFLNARDGILAADMTDNAGANQCLIWGVFAARQMGVSATSDASQRNVTSGTDVPATCVSSTTLTSSANPSVFGQTVTITATVAPVPPASGTAQGTVTFKEGATTLATIALNGSGQAALVSSSFSVGSHTINAKYNGDGNLSPSTAVPLVQTVNRDDTTTTVASSANPSVFGQPVTFTATVTANPPGSGTPSGTATFFDGGAMFATRVLVAGQATATNASLSVGTHLITVAYGGDGNFNSSTSAPFTQTVLRAATSTTVTSSVNPSTFGQAVTFTATVSVVPPGAGSPTGTVTFKDGAFVLGSAPLSATFHAAFTTAALQVGSHSITATYGGDGNFLPSTSAPLIQSVRCTTTITGKHGKLVVSAGATCVDNATIHGGITVLPGGALSVTNSTVDGGITSTGATALTVCQSRINGASDVAASTGFVLIGDAGDDGPPGCAGNTLNGLLTLTGNMGLVELGHNRINGGARLINTSGSAPTVEDMTSEIESNMISGTLSCSGNSPAPVNDGRPNTVTGQRLGQCAAPGF
jgi:hypothetical protein